jgi:hypothetical protein
MGRLKSYARSVVDRTVDHFAYRVIRQLMENSELRRYRDLSTEQHWRAKAEQSGNPLLRQGAKYYSQNDEDGIVRAILGRIGLERGVFVEFGCGDGLENNTAQLLMQGWSGVWIDGGELAVKVPAASKRLAFVRDWVTSETCVPLMRRGLEAIGAATHVVNPNGSGDASGANGHAGNGARDTSVNLVSMDLDGNDLHFVRTILEAHFAPELFIVEYNAKFPPPIRFAIDYDPAYTWQGGDYSGASLQSFVDLFGSFGYRLVCCNVTGINAFFVRDDHADRFADVPADPQRLFMPPDYNWFIQSGHRADPRAIEYFLRPTEPTK